MVDIMGLAEMGDAKYSKIQSSSEGKRRRGSSSLSDYTLGDCLGRGASGSVYRAINYTTGETVAIKQIRLSDLPQSELGAIMREIDLLKNLNHPHIVQYHGFLKSADSLYIILEFCENGSLHNICKNFGKFPEHLVGRYTGQVLDGLFYLHEQGVIHRDIKGANILTTKEGHIKLADFGVATRANDATVVGTPYWMAPEVIELIGATTASDIWSVGCTVIELLTGDPPYYDLTPMQALFRIVSDDHPSLPDGASGAVRDFLMQCFQKDPNLRVSARKLLRHPWIVKTRPISKEPNPKYVDDVRSVQQWNEALKMPLDINNSRSKATLSLQVPQAREDNQSRTGFAALQESSFDDNWDDDFTTSINSSSFDLTHFKTHDIFGGNIVHGIPEHSANKQALSRGGRVQDEDNMDTIKPKKIDFLKSAGLDLEQSKFKARPTANPPTLSESYPPGGKSLFPASFADRLDGEEGDEFGDSVEDGYTSKPLQEHGQLGVGLKRQVDKLRRGHSIEKSSLLPGLPDTKIAQPRSKDDSSLDELKAAAKIHKYTEIEEEDDFSDIFWVPELLSPKHEATTKRSHLQLTPKFVDSSAALLDEYEDDPFSELEEGLTELDLDANIARDQLARLCTEVSGHIESLKTQQTGIYLEDTTAKLLGVLLDSPETKTAVIASHGLLPILEVLESGRNREVNITLLRVINALTFNDIELLENLCFVGGIPTITKFATKHHYKEIRLEAAIFIRQICHMSRLTLQMFVSCGGLNVLVELIEDDYSTHKELALTGIEGVVDVFKLQGSTPKNDFCRILSRHMVLRPLSLALSQICREKEDRYESYCDKIVNLFFLFSQAENQVKEAIADRITLKRVLKDLHELPIASQITMLKFVKNLSMLSTTLDILQNANAIEVLTEMLSENVHKPQYKVQNHDSPRNS
ncbi:Myosin-IIIB [Orbilia brochopaga]|nr:Myosin-IIIB [Drechslerella brochopaga]